MYHPTDRIAHATAFGIPAVEHWLEREIAQWDGAKALMYKHLLMLGWLV